MASILGPRVQRRQPAESVPDAVEVPLSFRVGLEVAAMVVAAAGVGDRREDQVEVFAVKAGHVLVKVDRLPTQ